MQTYTHLTVGLAAGTALFPDNYLAQGIFVAGSVVSDAPNAIKMILDKVRGNKPFADMEKSSLINNICHSFLVWVGIIFACMVAPQCLHFPTPTINQLFAFGLSGLCHCFIDMLTHSGKKFIKTDHKIIWPFNVIIRGIWEYRYDHGVLRPKPFELAVNIAAIITTITLIVMRVIFLI